MERFRPDTYGESFAEVYDEWYQGVSDAEAVASFVAARAGAGPVLELGVGTGRLAAPLLARGRAVVGLDASAAMLARCRDRGLEGSGLRLVRADMAALPFRGPVGAVLIGFNTLFNLVHAEAQRSLFAQAAAVLGPGGVLVVEANQTDALAGGPARWIGPSSMRAAEAADGPARAGTGRSGAVTVVATELDREAQVIVGQHVEVGPGGVRFRPWRLRWATTDQIDGFARAAGLVLAERHGGWSGEVWAPGG
ncbi:MAG: class I SAM-dependent methyltransferase, partial [Acidimicrobiia bacterium]|nr:class I SAM-dependent methyltransferase [Acidimicrobiia bacterium]